MEQSGSYLRGMGSKASKLLTELEDIIRFADFLWREGYFSMSRLETAFKYETDLKDETLDRDGQPMSFCNWSQTSFPIHCFGRIWIFQWLTITANVWDLTFLLFFNKYICKIHNTFEYNLCRFNTYMVLKIGDFFDGHPWKRVILATDAPPPSSSMSVICDTHFLMLPRICRCGKYRRNLSTTKMQAKHQPNHIIVTLNQCMLSVWILKHVMFY